MTQPQQQRNIPRQQQPWEKAVDQGLEIQRLIDEDVPEHAFTEADGFFDDVAEKVRSVVETIERTKNVTRNQQKALDGWQGGVEAWIK